MGWEFGIESSVAFWSCLVVDSIVCEIAWDPELVLELKLRSGVEITSGRRSTRTRCMTRMYMMAMRARMERMRKWNLFLVRIESEDDIGVMAVRSIFRQPPLEVEVRSQKENEDERIWKGEKWNFGLE